ncbi:MAG: TRAP transporter small permease subunit [Pseudomonadota bacterium]
MDALGKRLDRLSQWVGECVAWLTLIMVLVTFTVVVLRYVFAINYIWMQEAVTWMHAAVFMLGAAYALERGEHVRVDVFYRHRSAKMRALIDTLGVVFLLIPLMAFFIFVSWDYVTGSWAIREGSRQAQGLPFPATPLLKSLLILMPVLVTLQGISMVIRAWLHPHDVADDLPSEVP